MFDPGVMGTLIVGLDNVRRRTEADAASPAAERLAARSRPTRSVRADLANRLRAAADRLQPGEVGADVGRA